MRAARFLPAIGRHIPIEVRLFEFTLAITAFVLYFWTIWGVFFGYQWPVMTIYISGSIIYTGFYVAQKQGVSFQFLTLSYYILAFILLALGWLPSGGLNGAIMNMFILAFVSGMLILEPKYFLMFISTTLGLVLGFSLYELFHPDAAAKYLDQQSWMLDVSVSNLVMLAIVGFTMLVFKREYLRDKLRIKRINGQLEIEKMRAESADKAKTSFLANISHEMRTPLNGIRGTSELLRNTDLNDEQYEMVQTLTYSSDILYGLISDILDVTMIKEERLVLYEHDLDIRKTIDEVVDFFQPDFDTVHRAVNLVKECGATIPPVLLGDQSRLRQVLINLVNNAIRNTKTGEVLVKAELADEIQEVVSIRFSVEDSGVNEQDFEDFSEQPVSGSTAETALGLNICKKIVEAMGGEASFSSDSASRSSQFYFTLPFKKMDAVEGSLNGPAQLASITDLKILVVDDQKINQLVARKMLQNIGVEQIDVCESGEEAVDWANNKNYDLILMDIRMPGMDGIMATREILRMNKPTQPIIIALTANVMKADKEECLEAGMKDFISKPFTTDILESTLKKFIHIAR